jgi:hypothetical protein
MNTTLIASWSGLSRPSTSSFAQDSVQDVDARHKGEHDGWSKVVLMGSGLVNGGHWNEVEATVKHRTHPMLQQ